jgi:hypothetical protein
MDKFILNANVDDFVPCYYYEEGVEEKNEKNEELMEPEKLSVIIEQDRRDDLLPECIVISEDPEVIYNDDVTAYYPQQMYEALYRPAEVLILGDSFVRRLNEFLIKRDGICHNMQLHYVFTNVNWIGIGGITGEVLRQNNLPEVEKFCPDIVLIHVGSNELGRFDVHPSTAASVIIDLAMDLRDLGVTKVVISQILFRGEKGFTPGMFDYNSKVYHCNGELKELCNYFKHITYWSHRGMVNGVFSILDQHQTHLSQYGEHKLARSLRGAIIQAHQRTLPQLRL